MNLETVRSMLTAHTKYGKQWKIAETRTSSVAQAEASNLLFRHLHQVEEKCPKGACILRRVRVAFLKNNEVLWRASPKEPSLGLTTCVIPYYYQPRLFRAQLVEQNISPT